MIVKFNKLFFSQLMLLIITSIFLSGCQHQKIYKMQANLSISIKEIEKIPFRVGLYIDPELMNYSMRSRYIPGIIHLGESLSKGAENIVSKAFKETVIIYTKDPELIPKGLDALVIPEIDKIYVFGEEGGIGSYTTVIVKIKWSIIDKNGKILYINTFTGEEKYRRPTTIFSMFPRLCEGSTKATEDHFTKAFIGITSTNWWGAIKRETN